MTRSLEGAEYTSDEGEILRVETFTVSNKYVVWNTGEKTKIKDVSGDWLTIERPTGGWILAKMVRT